MPLLRCWCHPQYRNVPELKTLPPPSMHCRGRPTMNLDPRGYTDMTHFTSSTLSFGCAFSRANPFLSSNFSMNRWRIPCSKFRGYLSKESRMFFAPCSSFRLVKGRCPMDQATINLYIWREWRRPILSSFWKCSFRCESTRQSPELSLTEWQLLPGRQVVNLEWVAISLEARDNVANGERSKTRHLSHVRNSEWSNWTISHSQRIQYLGMDSPSTEQVGTTGIIYQRRRCLAIRIGLRFEDRTSARMSSFKPAQLQWKIQKRWSQLRF